MGSDITEYVNADSGWKISFVDYINIDCVMYKFVIYFIDIQLALF
ncbi:hypothetical protein BMETH_22113134441202, partial [methanotrophic bacterial endosymbiont of Bathymodiolus sp.]